MGHERTSGYQRVAGIIVNVVKITSRRRAQVALREDRRTDPSHLRCRHHNPSFRNQVVCPREEVQEEEPRSLDWSHRMWGPREGTAHVQDRYWDRCTEARTGGG